MRTLILAALLLLIAASTIAAAEAPAPDEDYPPIAKFRFTGNTAISSDALRDAMKSTIGRKPDLTILGADVDRIVEMYENLGYVQVKVEAANDPAPDGKGDIYTVTIKEGVRHRVGTVAVQGNTRFTTDQLLALLRVEADGYFTRAGLRDGEDAIRRLYGNVGCLTTAVRGLTVGVGEGLLNVVCVVKESPPVRLEAIEIRSEGRPETRRDFILRTLRLKTGELLTLTHLEAALKHLFKRGWFAGVHYELEPGSTPDQVRLIVIVTEGKTARATIAGSVATYLGLGLRFEFAERNFDIASPPRSWQDVKNWDMFRGGGESLVLNLQPGTRFSSYGFDFGHPYIFDTENTLLVSGEAGIIAGPDYDVSDWKTRFGLGRDLSDTWTVSGGVLFQGKDITDLDLPAAPDVLAAKGYTPGYGLWGRLGYSTREEGPLPTRGSEAAVTLEPLHVDTDFVRTVVTASRLFPLGGEPDRAHVVELRGKLGEIAGSAPFFERFFCGGLGSVRGFAASGIGPHQLDTPVGGRYLATGTIEYGFPIVRIIKDFHLRGVAFVDAGEVEDHVSDLGRIRVGAGAGIRFFMPKFGGSVMGIDYGVPLVKEEGDHTQNVTFALGMRL